MNLFAHETDIAHSLHGSDLILAGLVLIVVAAGAFIALRKKGRA